VVRRFVHVEHPIDPELVGKHAKAGCPEGLLQRHSGLAILRQRVEELVGFIAIEKLLPCWKGLPGMLSEAMRTTGPLASRACMILS
jgi:hypothetical protein